MNAMNTPKNIVLRIRLELIHPYDDNYVIAGQGTIGIELTTQVQDLPDYVFIPVGGGGLISGVAAFIKYYYPQIKIIGVEEVGSASMSLSFQEKKRSRLQNINIFCDGIAVACPGELPFHYLSIFNLVDDFVQISVDEVCAGIKSIFDELAIVVEPSGAASLAGIQKYVQDKNIRNARISGIICGANIDFERLRFIAERTEIGAKRETLFAAHIPEKKGSLRNFCKILGKTPLTEFHYRYQQRPVAAIFVGIKNNKQGAEKIFAALAKKSIEVTDFSDQEIAKEHVVHMVGGKLPEGMQEVLLQFSFPEKPGALQNFLESLCDIFSISLFHYRNFGGESSKVLIGFVIDESNTEDELYAILQTIPYSYINVSHDKSYSYFL